MLFPKFPLQTKQDIYPTIMSTNFFFIEAFSDTALHMIHTKAMELGMASTHYYYENLLGDYTKIRSLDINEDTILFMALPFTANNIQQNYQSVVEIIRDVYRPRVIVNREMLDKNFLTMEDKFFQPYIFEKLGVAHEPLVDVYGEEVDFPLIARKRISSRSKNNFLIPTKRDLSIFKKKNDVTAFVFQAYKPLIQDLRIYVWGDEIFEVVERRVQIKEHNRVAVKVSNTATIPDNIAEDAIKITKEIGANFLGLDVGRREDGGYFFIEYNGRAQIRSAEKTLGLGLPSRLVEKLSQL